MFRQKSSYKTITPQQLNERLNQGDDLVLVDVRSANEYQNDGHIAGTRLLPLFTLPVRHTELPKDKPLVLICRSGGRSSMACEQLAQLGYTNLINLTGGTMGWQSAGLPTQ